MQSEKKQRIFFFVYRWDVGEHFCHLLDLAQRHSKRGENLTQNLLEFKIYLEYISQDLNSIKADNGMSLIQKACEYGLDKHTEALLTV